MSFIPAATMKQNDEKIFSYYTGFLSGLLLICFAGAIIGDSTAEALLLSRCKVTLLPKMFLVNALGLFIASAFIMSIIDRVDRGRLFLVVVFSHAAVLLLVRAALLAKINWIFVPLFTYAYIAKILLFLLFWTLANDLIDPRRAQKTFPFVAAGGTLGAIIMAFAIPGMVRFFAPENLLFVWSACACGLGLLFIPLRARVGKSFHPSSDHERRRHRTPATTFSDMKIIGTDPLLSTMALLYGILFFTLLTQHYFFYVQVKEHFASANRIAAFLGFFSGTSIMVTVLLQSAVAGRILKKFGSSRSMLLLPTVLCAVFIALTVLSFRVLPGSFLLFAAIVAGMGLRIAFFDTFFSPNFQIFFSSLPQELRGRAKLTIEGVVKPLAIAAAGIWLMTGAIRISFSINMLVLSAGAAAAFLVTMRLKARYTESLTRFLSAFSGSEGFAALSAKGGDIDLSSAVKMVLTKGNYEVQKFLIDELADSCGAQFFEMVKDHVHHPDPRVRAALVSALGRFSRKEHRDFLVSCLSDSDEEVVANAIMAVGNYREPVVSGIIEPFLSNASGYCRANAAIVLWKHGAFRKKDDIVRHLSAMLDVAHEDECMAAIYALGEIDTAETFICLRDFAQVYGRMKTWESAGIYRQLVLALGKKSYQDAIGLLLEQAKGASRLQRIEIIAALEMMLRRGQSFNRMAGILRNGDPLDRNILLRAIHGSRTVWPAQMKALLRSLVDGEIEEVEHDRESVREIERYRGLKSVELLTLAIREESVGLRLETIVYAISLLDDSGTIRKIINRLFSTNALVRARALEVLDNAGEIALNRQVMKTLDGESTVATVKTTATASPAAVVAQRVTGYIANINTWIGRCASCASEEITAAAAAV